MDEITINPNRIDLDEAYMQMAEVWAKRSKANRLQVGALIVKDRQIISDGYNGMPAGDKDDTCEFFANGVNAEQGLVTKKEVLHAESNALMKLSENGGVGAQGATIYTTWSPCFECAKLIRQAKVRRVVFRNQYRDQAGIDFLRQRGVQVEHLTAEPVAFQGAGQVFDAPAEPVVRQTKPSVPRPSVLQQIASPNASIAAGIRAQQAAPAPAPAPAPAATPEIVDPFALPLVKPEGAPSEDEVMALLRAHEASLNLSLPVDKKTPTPQAEGPYKSGFL